MIVASPVSCINKKKNPGLRLITCNNWYRFPKILFTARMWMGCAVFCRRAAGGGFYAPRIELNDAGLDPYFPDGTWCHHDGAQDYYCLQHHCLPEVPTYFTHTSLEVLYAVVHLKPELDSCFPLGFGLVL